MIIAFQYKYHLAIQRPIYMHVGVFPRNSLEMMNTLGRIGSLSRSVYYTCIYRPYIYEKGFKLIGIETVMDLHYSYHLLTLVCQWITL